MSEEIVVISSDSDEEEIIGTNQANKRPGDADQQQRSAGKERNVKGGDLQAARMLRREAGQQQGSASRDLSQSLGQASSNSRLLAAVAGPSATLYRTGSAIIGAAQNLAVRAGSALLHGSSSLERPTLVRATFSVFFFYLLPVTYVEVFLC